VNRVEGEGKKNPCGHDDCACSTGICERLTFGRGKLSDNGYWEIPCDVCARTAESRDGVAVGSYWPTNADLGRSIQREARIKEAMELSDRLFTLANEFAVAGEGDVAVLLHAACNDVNRAKDQLEGKKGAI